MKKCLLALSAALLISGCFDGSSDTKTKEESFIPAPNPANEYDFKLTGVDNKTYSLKDFQGKRLIIYFGYTQCADICPSSLSSAGEILDDLQPKNAVLLLITLDPKRDSAEDTLKYVRDFYDNSFALVPSEDELKRLAHVYGVKYQYIQQDSAADYTVAHSSEFYLIDENGKYVGKINNMARTNLIKKFKEFLFN